VSVSQSPTALPPPLPPRAATHRRQVDFSVSRSQADADLKLDVGQRIYVYVKPAAMMAYEQQQIESAPLV
jgi:hypothetical protein